MQFMVIETFRDKGRIAPDGLKHVSSWTSGAATAEALAGGL